MKGTRNQKRRLIIYPIMMCLSLIGTACAGASGKESGTSTTTKTATAIPELFLNNSFLTGIPCELPCWNGLLVGETTYSEAIAILQSLSFIDSETIQFSGVTGRGTADIPNDKDPFYIHADCVLPEGEQCVFMEVQIGKVVWINSSINFSFTLSEMVEHFGEPSYIEFGSGASECMDCHLEVVWKEFQMVISIIEPRCKEGRVMCENLWEGKLIPAQKPVYSLYILQKGEFNQPLAGMYTRREWPGLLIP
jgi:hypothetical protein